jgi:hypothetical protein
VAQTTLEMRGDNSNGGEVQAVVTLEKGTRMENTQVDVQVHEIVGTTVKNGDFNGKPWHNAYLHVQTPFEDDKGSGMEVDIKKIKVSMLSAVFGKPTKISDLPGMVGNVVSLYHDKHGTVILVRAADS